MPSSDKSRPYPYSVRWTQVRVAEGYWRDDRKKSTAAEEADAGASAAGGFGGARDASPGLGLW